MITNKLPFPDPNKTIEKTMVEKGSTKLRSHVESARNRDQETETCYGQRLLREACPDLVTAIEKWFVQQEKAPVPSIAYVELKKVEPKTTAFIALKSVIDCLTQRRSLCSAAVKVGALIEDEICFDTFSVHPNYKKILRGANKRPSYKKKRHYIKLSMKGEARQGNFEMWSRWGTRTKLHIGTVLIELIRQSTGLVDYVLINTGRKGKQRFIQATDKTADWIEGMIAHNQSLDPFWMPLTDFPVMWDNKWEGGYKTDNGLPPLPFIKTRELGWLRENNEPITDVMSSVNHLQNTMWKVNPYVYDCLKTIWDEDIKIGSLPKRVDEELPPISEAEKENDHLLTMWKRRAAKVYDYNTATRSRRLLVLNTLALANQYKTESKFFLPHQCDFRGRVYAVPSYLSHMGADFNKGLMTFAAGSPIKRDDDLMWLHIHGANTFGVKGTIENRIKWAADNQQQIYEIGKDFKSHLDMVDEADETFQFIAYCREVFEIHNGKKVTHLPVHMDGTNNGLQILGMLTRDTMSCEATNVANLDAPQDIYQIVADTAVYMMKEEVDNPFTKAWVDFGIDRGCAKRPTMTQPYGSTPHSCRNYVNDWYADKVRGGSVDPFEEDVKFEAVSFLSSKVWSAINEVVGRPREAMRWLQRAARVLVENDHPLYWVTPSGFPCYQAYKKWEQKAIRTRIGNKLLRVKFREDGNELSGQRMAQGISPNFVHSLDASCLHLTVNKCAERLGLTSFAMVHDSYGTHSTNCIEMGKMLRETLYEIFSVDQLDIFKQSVENYSGLELDSLPTYGNFNISDVLKSKYVFS